MRSDVVLQFMLSSLRKESYSKLYANKAALSIDRVYSAFDSVSIFIVGSVNAFM